MILTVPALPEDIDILGAAIAYADNGFYVGPLKAGTKDPSSTLGTGWPQKTSRDPQVIASWFAGTDYGLFLHAGRSGAVIFDVDNPAKRHPLITQAIMETQPPTQSSRPDQPGRCHHLFRMPPGRDLGNGVGTLGGGWGDVRGRNGLIVAAPTPHPGGGRYEWLRTGAVPALPSYLADALPDAHDAAQAASDAVVEVFLATHTGNSHPELLDVQVRAFEAKVAAGESRHATLTGHLAGAMKEARAGYFPARTAADTLQALFLAAVAHEGHGQQGEARGPAQARNEWAGVLAWAVAQANAADLVAVRERAAEQVPQVTHLPEISVDASTGETDDGADGSGGRRLVLTPASAIKPCRVRDLWTDRLALGTLGLLAGREGLGKSTVGYWLAARVTRGEVPGEYLGIPKAVLVCATEDSWEHTIVPRLIAADADLDKVFRVEVVTADDLHFGLSLPRDLQEMELNAQEVDAALLLLDPLMSRLSESIDTHRDGDVRRALEPLVALAGRVGMAVLGLIHHNKSGSTDPLQLVMGSKAFTAVARSVHTVVPDPDDETGQRRLFGTPKNNLRPDDRPTLAFTITGAAVPTEDGDTYTSRIMWGEELDEKITDTMRRAGGSDEERTAASEAAEWLSEYLASNGGVVSSASAKRAARAAGHSESALQRARKNLRLWHDRRGYPGETFWGDPRLADRDPAPVASAVVPAP